MLQTEAGSEKLSWCDCVHAAALFAAATEQQQCNHDHHICPFKLHY
jgi:hypothetical protein